MGGYSISGKFISHNASIGFKHEKIRHIDRYSIYDVYNAGIFGLKCRLDRDYRDFKDLKAEMEKEDYNQLLFSPIDYTRRNSFSFRNLTDEQYNEYIRDERIINYISEGYFNYLEKGEAMIFKTRNLGRIGFKTVIENPSNHNITREFIGHYLSKAGKYGSMLIKEDKEPYYDKEHGGFSTFPRYEVLEYGSHSDLMRKGKQELRENNYKYNYYIISKNGTFEMLNVKAVKVSKDAKSTSQTDIKNIYEYYYIGFCAS